MMRWHHSADTNKGYEKFLLSQEPLFLLDQPGDERLYIKASMERYDLQMAILTDRFAAGKKQSVGLQVLDVGCYPGHLALLLKRFLQAEVTGVGITDYTMFNARMARNDIRFIKVNIEKQPLPFADGSFDVLLFTEVMEHLFNPFLIFKEMSRVIRKNGVLLLSTPNLASLRNRIRFLQGKNINEDLLVNNETIANPTGTQELEYPVHARFYMPVELIVLLNKYGFALRSERYQNFPTAETISLKERFLRKISGFSPALGDTVTMLAVKQ